jgi:hypothetical protein
MAAKKVNFAKRTHFLKGYKFCNVRAVSELQKSGVGKLYTRRCKTNPN